MARGKVKALHECYIVVVGAWKEWTPGQISKWIRANGGTQEYKITDQTTHVVVTQKGWKNQIALVKEALGVNRNYDPGISIVSFDWLEDCLVDKVRKRESAYLWEAIDPASTKQEKRSQKGKAVSGASQATAKENEVQGSKNTQGMLADVLIDSTDSFLGEKDKQKIQKDFEMNRRAREELEAEEREKERESAMSKHAAAFKQGAHKARNDIFSENHHVYADDTNFKYDIHLTKVDTRHNKNERWVLTLQIYESNSEPYTYAMNAQFASTDKTASNNILAAVGCNFPTAFRVFKKTFKEHTGVEWDDRITHAIERNRRAKLDRGRATGSDVGTVRGLPVSESAARPVDSDEDFATMPFLYLPPAYGSKGALPESGQSQVPPGAANSDANERQQALENERIESWMSGANGTADRAGQEPLAVPGHAEPKQNAVQNSNSNISDPVNPDSRGVPIMVENNDTFGDMLDFDFDNPPYAQGLVSNQGGTAQDTFHEADAIGWDLVNMDTQGVGETQLAEKARDGLQTFMDQQKLSNRNEQSTTGVALSQLELDSSVLGKRKTPPEAEKGQNFQNKLRRAQVEDRFVRA